MAIRSPFSACVDAGQGKRIATSGCALLAMTQMGVLYSDL